MTHTSSYKHKSANGSHCYIGKRDQMGWDGMGWDEMRWDEMRWDEMRWDEMRWEGMGCDGMRWDEKKTYWLTAMNDAVLTGLSNLTFKK